MNGKGVQRPQWHKITVDVDSHWRWALLQEQLGLASLKDPQRFKRVAICTPLLKFTQKYDPEGATTTVFFSPDVATFFWNILAPHNPVACEAPPQSEVGISLWMGLEDPAEFWRAAGSTQPTASPKAGNP